MIYLSGFSMPSGGVIDNYSYPTAYPFGIFELMDLTYIKMNPVTIFYGGNGSGKSTLLRIIADKCGLKHRTIVDKTEHYKVFLKLCEPSYDEEYGKNIVPANSKIITSEDIMDNILQLRILNKDIGNIRDNVEQEYSEKKYEPNRLESLSEFDEFKKRNRMKRLSKTKYLNETGGIRKREHSNGENVMQYFENELEPDKVYLLDEPEVSLSPAYQIKLSEKIIQMSRYLGCQFIIATHSPFILGIKNAIIYDMDEYPVCNKQIEELESIRLYYKFFKQFNGKIE